MKTAWEGGSISCTISQVGKKIKRCQRDLQRWRKQSFCNISRALIEKRSFLKFAEEATQLGGDYNPVYTIKKEISELLLLEEQLWHQRFCAHWMKSGDKNTAFFHSKASKRLRRNRIDSLRNNDGVLCSDEAEVTGLLVSYYKQLFTSSQPMYFEAVFQESHGWSLMK